MVDKVNSYRDLEVWKLAMDLAEQVYALTRSFPKEELYGMTSQIRRAAVSVCSNIAEGSSRRSTGEFVQFVNIASGSLAELENQLMLARRFGYITQDALTAAMKLCDRVSKMLYALQRALTEKAAA